MRFFFAVPPTRIEIDGVPSGSRLNIRENEIVELSCIVHQAKPKATIVWFRENTEFFTDSRQDKDQIGERDGRVTTTSTIKFRPTSSDNSVTWACEADHPALINPPLRSTVLLSVLHPPGPPEISGYIEGETIRLGQTVTLVCTAAGGNPLATINWYRNGIKVDTSYTTSGRESRNTYSFLAATEDNNAKFRCESENELSPVPQSAEIILSVQFAPATVELRGSTEARAGEELTYECSTSNSNPAATIQWVVDNTTVASADSYNEESPLGGYVTHANVTVRVRPSDRNKIISCNVVNSELNDIKTESTMLTVIYPPGPPQVQGLDDGEVLTAGSLKRLTCTSISGNPLATLKWFNGEKELVSIYLTRDSYASAEVAFVPRGSDNGGQLRCEATNVASTVPLVVTKNISVDFGPEYVKVSVRPQRPRAGHNATLVCETASSLPSASITWWTNGERLEGATEMIVDGDYGGFVTSSHLQLTLTAQHHGVVVTCDASNGLPDQRAHDAITLSVSHKPVFSAETNGNPLELVEGTIAVVNMTATANPMPVEYKWTKETSDNSLVDVSKIYTDRLSVVDGILNFSRVHRDDSGYYTISATNAEGTAQTKIQVDVLYAPRITDITSSVLVGEGEPAHLECAVDANPLTESTIRWERPAYDMTGRTKTTMGSPTTSSFSEGDNTQMLSAPLAANSVNSFHARQKNIGVVLLTVLNSTAEDSGQFWCVASNRVGGTVARNATYLLVRHKPVIRKNPMTAKSASDIGETARLICEARGVPNVTFSWTRSSGQRLADGPKYKIANRMMDPLTWHSEFLIYNVTNNDYGGYECVARNSEGITRQQVDLDVKSRPDTPMALRVSNVTHRAVKLEWQPGFHGGMDQYFRLRYVANEPKHGRTRYWDVYPANTNNAVLNDLEPGVQYSIDIMAINNLGESNYTRDPVIVRTSSRPPLGSREQMIREALEDQGEIPMIVIVSVSVCGTILLLLNIVLISCFVHKRKQKEKLQGHNGQQKAPSEGSASTGSTKSATMELYTASSYNETMSGGGETLSSISEKSCISNNHSEFPPQAFMEDNYPYSRSTYLVDPPMPSQGPAITFDEQVQTPYSPVEAQPPINAYDEDPMSLYSVVHKTRKPPSSSTTTTATLRDHSDSPSSIEQQQQHQLQQNYEDTESEYAHELRKQTYRHKMGEHGGYATRNGGVYSTLPHHHHHHHHMVQQMPRHVHLAELDLDLRYSPTTPIVIDTCNGVASPINNNGDAPLCASSPKRSFTTFGQRHSSASTVTTPLSPTVKTPNGPMPTTGHLV